MDKMEEYIQAATRDNTRRSYRAAVHILKRNGEVFCRQRQTVLRDISFTMLIRWLSTPYGNV